MDHALLISRYAAQQGQPGWSRQRLLHEALRHAIRSGSLPPGSRLLASRALAAELGWARNTVIYAYEQLASEGWISAGRRGTVVHARPASVLAGSGRSVGPGALAARDLPAPVPESRGLSRRSAGLACLPVAADLAAAFAPGVPALDAFPLDLWRRLMMRAWRSLVSSQLNYGPPAGEPALREAIAAHLRASRAVRCSAEQVFITDGTQASLDLCARAFADAGDKVWIESPGYGGALTAFRAAQLRPIGIAVDAQGLTPRPQDWLQHRPRLIYVTPSHQYPSGAVMSLERRLALIAQARQAGALIIEDDYDSEFRYDGPPLAALQGLGTDIDTLDAVQPASDAPVLYLGTFSKTLFPGLRIGFMVVPPDRVQLLHHLLARSAPRGRAAEQLALAEFMREGHFGLHLRRMRRLYQQRRDALVAALERQLGDIAQVRGASAGMHLALCFEPELGLDDQAISAAALQAGIVAPALSQHRVGRRASAWSGLMLGYAQVPAEQMAGKVARLSALIRAELR
ncbi:PLP-dependent aminotransferase family protein [Paucibacter sp. DJ1R-11]|uniref:MocR-like pyridoxine biosynthesis transcription factor PdxR n=1 Tax=Paucibacter sp. DJ1R-11 TaxID=2893556 RepID=UPI0021E46DAE|nr:PLP-dependent aminotransferase family protein [Paucibacter sp. DJ1R-11]MCV2364028.1 PLP-dependent aminotransferase family protein [Paucibacter sp. DJ1R-11]